jgi:hypothetical protein
MRRLAALCALVVLGGCGLGEGAEKSGEGAQLRVTRDFGRELLSSARQEKLKESSTVMRLVQASNDVETRYGGRFVQSIDGLEGGGSGGSVDWFFFVNGLESEVGAAEYALSPGDVVQWDHRNWRGTPDVRAIVGAFPEPFRSGSAGKRRPVRVECGDADEACQTVKRVLRDAGVPATGSSLGATGTQNVIRVVVAPWQTARDLPSVAVLEQEPKRSGVFARFTEEGRLRLLDQRGRTVRDAGTGAGLVAAVIPRDDELVWVVTGGSSEGVDAAASALDPATLRDAFAVAVTPSGAEKLPLESK